MGLPVVLTPQSRDDLKRIVSYIAQHNPERARSFGNELIDRALAIGAFPELGRTVPEVNDATVREVIYGPYRIIYEIFQSPDAIYILRFWHGARGVPPI
jgi:plasmid stabilization system protein ParE